MTASGNDVRTTVLLLKKGKRADKRNARGLSKRVLASEHLSLIGAGNQLQPVAI